MRVMLPMAVYDGAGLIGSMTIEGQVRAGVDQFDRTIKRGCRKPAVGRSVAVEIFDMYGSPGANWIYRRRRSGDGPGQSGIVSFGAQGQSANFHNLLDTHTH